MIIILLLIIAFIASQLIWWEPIIDASVDSPELFDNHWLKAFIFQHYSEGEGCGLIHKLSPCDFILQFSLALKQPHALN